MVQDVRRCNDKGARTQGNGRGSIAGPCRTAVWGSRAYVERPLAPRRGFVLAYRKTVGVPMIRPPDRSGMTGPE